jgi:hypothetical protein
MANKVLILVFLTLAAFRMNFAQTENRFELYLLPPTIQSKDLAKLDLKKLKPEGQPFFTSDDISSYVMDTHEMVLYYPLGLKLKKLEVPVSGQPFAVFVGGKPIYTGAFWTSLSSISFRGVTINVSDLKGDFPVLKLELDYPPLAPKHIVTDPRLDPKIFLALKNRGVLREEVWMYGKCRQIQATRKRRQSFVFTFDVTSVVKSTYEHPTVTFEIFDDHGKSLREALDADWKSSFGIEDKWRFDADKLILLKFERRVSDEPQNVYLSDFAVK